MAEETTPVPRTENRIPRPTEGERDELWSRLNDARDRYVDLTARRQRMGFFSQLASKQRLQEARQEYEGVRNAAGGVAAWELRDEGYSDDAIKEFAVWFSIKETHDVTAAIAERRIDLTENATGKKFYAWWARQGGKGNLVKGSLKKSAAMAGIGFVPGLVAGAAGAAVFGPLVGAAVATGVARGVARGLAGAKISQRSEDHRTTVADLQRRAHLNQGVGGRGSGHVPYLLGIALNDQVLTTEHITRGVEAATRHEVRRNRRRMLGAAAIGAVSGLGGAFLASAFADSRLPFTGRGAPKLGVPDVPGTPEESIVPKMTPSTAPPESPHTTLGPSLPREIPKPPVVPEQMPESGVFYVESGHGYTHELQDYIVAHGGYLNGGGYYELHAELMDRFGPDYLTGISKYTIRSGLYRGDIGLAHTGYARWSPGVERYMQEYMARHQRLPLAA